MKRLIVVLVILFTMIYKNAECQLGYFNYSYSYEFGNDENIKNHSVGYEHYFDSIFGIHGNSIGFFLRGLNNSFTIDLQYCLCIMGPESGDFFIIFGPGMNILYNFNTNIFGISPQVDVMIMMIFLNLHVTYRYNIYFKQKNSQEFCFIVGIVNIFSLLSLL